MLDFAQIFQEKRATMSGRTLAHAASALAMAAGIALQPNAAAQLQLNEFMAHGSDHRTRLDSHGRQVVGVGVQWQDEGYDDSFWQVGSAPFGFGLEGVATDLRSEIFAKTPSLHLRRRVAFTPPPGVVAQPLGIEIRFNDGFILWINGREVFRKNTGAAGSVVFADQSAFSPVEAVQTATIILDDATQWLTPGENIIALQIQNFWPAPAETPVDPTLFGAASITVGAAEPIPLVAGGAEWNYFIGRGEPSGIVFDPADYLAGRDDLTETDWVEIKNISDAPVNVLGWSLADAENASSRWTLPNRTLPPGECLLIYCGGEARLNGGTGAIHAPFKLSREGEYLALSNPAAEIVDSVGKAYPRQDLFHSYGRVGAGGEWAHMPNPTPGAPNQGPYLWAMVAKPLVRPEAGFHAGPVSVQIACFTPGAEIRYTTDGSEPTLGSGARYLGEFLLTQSAVVRARAFHAEWVPSDCATRTFLINEPAEMASLPVLSIAGDPRKSIYGPEGIFAVQGGFFNADEAWVPDSLDDYHMAFNHGEAGERPVSVEFIGWNGEPHQQLDAGVRLAASTWSRPRMKLIDLEAGAWTNSWQNKPSMSLFFRDRYGPETLNFKAFPQADYAEFEHLRLRAGKNDWLNPFVRDETARRLYNQMGQHTSHGILANVFVNGMFKSYFNLAERLREPFFQQRHGSGNSWDVMHVGEILDGDSLKFYQDVEFVRMGDLAEVASYEEATRRFDVVNLADYLILNAYMAMWDWPNNNFYNYRERVAEGKWRFAVWDAEGAMGLYTTKAADYNTFTSDLSWNESQGFNALRTLPLLFTQFARSLEFRTLFADRLQRHLFNGGALTSTNILRTYGDLKTQLDPILIRVTKLPAHMAYVENWVAERPAHLLAHCAQRGLWTGVQAPSFSVPPGEVEAGTAVGIGLASESGAIYYTTDGSDPRAQGGGVAGQAYDSPIVVARTQTVKARTLQGETWSPLAEAVYSIGAPARLVLTEIHYAPAPMDDTAGRDLEFVEIHNPDDRPAKLEGVSFTAGIQFEFAADAELEPGGYLVLASNMEAFQRRYPGVAAHGAYSGQLDNAGERLTLSRGGSETLFTTRYRVESPWPASALGGGHSLVPSGASADAQEAAHWRASSELHGSPGRRDPDPALPSVAINEIACRVTGQNPWFVELINFGDTAVDIGGWSFSDDVATPGKVRIRDGLWIPAKGHYGLDVGVLTPGARNLLKIAGGGRLHLFSKLPGGEPGPLVSEVSFGAFEENVAQGFSPAPEDAAFFGPLARPTPGGANAPHTRPPIVISEIHLAPAPGEHQFIELHNASGVEQPLFDPQNPDATWRVDGVGFAFPTGVVLSPGEHVLVTPEPPSRFRLKYGVAPHIRIFGPWPGALQRGGERLRLEKPVSLADQVSAFVHLESFLPQEGRGWDPRAWSEGFSLQRKSGSAPAGMPENWFAAGLTPGFSNGDNRGGINLVRLASPTQGTAALFGETLQVEAQVDNVWGALSRLVILKDGVELKSFTNPPFSLNWTPDKPGTAKFEAIAHFDNGVAGASATASVSVSPFLKEHVALVARQAEWRYQDNGEEPPADWVLEGYDDSTWSMGAAELGYGENDEATVLSFGDDPLNKRLSYFFRRQFTAPDPRDLTDIEGLIWLDDGAVIYLNGEELLRLNMPEGAIQNGTHASTNVEGTEPIPFTLPSGRLKAGVNTLAVRVHQVQPASGDLSFALSLGSIHFRGLPEILLEPEDVAVELGDTAVFRAAAFGPGVATRWHRQGVGPLDATGPELRVENVSEEDFGVYWLEASNRHGTSKSRAATLGLLPFDGDSDGVPDHWERLHGLNPGDPSDAQADTDDDGISNLEEFLRGLNPRQPDLFLSPTVARDGEGRDMLRIKFWVPANRTAVVLSSEALEAPDWSPTREITPSPAGRQVEVEIPVELRGSFFRVRLP